MTNKLGIGVSAEEAAAILQVDSTSQGVLFPRMSEAQRDAISSPPTGLVIYNTDENEYQVWNGSSYVSLGGAGGGISSDTDAYASLTAGSAGDIAFPTDGYHIFRSTGAALVPWGPIFPLTLPSDSGFSWVNQDSAVLTTTGGALVLSRAASATASIRARVKTAPATPWTLTVCMIGNAMAVSAPNYGLIYRQSSDGKIVTFGSQAGTNIFSYKWTNATTYNSDYVTSVAVHVAPPFLRISDNGTNRVMSVSWDGQNFIQIHTVGRTDFLTADQIGFYVNPQNATYSIAVSLLSWSVT